MRNGRLYNPRFIGLIASSDAEEQNLMPREIGRIRCISFGYFGSFFRDNFCKNNENIGLIIIALYREEYIDQIKPLEINNFTLSNLSALYGIINTIIYNTVNFIFYL